MYAIHVGAECDDRQVIDQRNIICFFRDNIAGLYIVRNTILSDSGTTFKQQFGNLFVTSKNAIFPCVSVETMPGVYTIRINERGEVIEDICFIAAVCPFCGIGLIVSSFNGAVNANLKQLGLDDLRNSFQCRAGVDGEREFLTVVAGLCKEVSSGFRIIIDNDNSVFRSNEATVVGAHIHIQGLGASGINGNIDIILVNRGLNCLAEVDILAGTCPVIQVKCDTAGRECAVPCNAVYTVKTEARVERRIANNIIVTILEAEKLSVAVCNDLDNDILDGGFAFPVIFISGK